MADEVEPVVVDGGEDGVGHGGERVVAGVRGGAVAGQVQGDRVPAQLRGELRPGVLRTAEGV
jgi:hypothetical protein